MPRRRLRHRTTTEETEEHTKEGEKSSEDEAQTIRDLLELSKIEQDEERENVSRSLLLKNADRLGISRHTGMFRNGMENDGEDDKTGFQGKQGYLDKKLEEERLQYIQNRLNDHNVAADDNNHSNTTNNSELNDETQKTEENDSLLPERYRIQSFIVTHDEIIGPGAFQTLKEVHLEFLPPKTKQPPQNKTNIPEKHNDEQSNEYTELQAYLRNNDIDLNSKR